MPSPFYNGWGNTEATDRQHYAGKSSALEAIQSFRPMAGKPRRLDQSESSKRAGLSNLKCRLPRLAFICRQWLYLWPIYTPIEDSLKFVMWQRSGEDRVSDIKTTQMKQCSVLFTRGERMHSWVRSLYLTKLCSGIINLCELIDLLLKVYTYWTMPQSHTPFVVTWYLLMNAPIS